MKRSRKIWLSLGLAVLLGGAAAIGSSFLSGGEVEYAHVVSIRSAHEYQDPALLEKAWALPVAALYHSQMVFQRNPSVCGPASVVNVLHSLHRPADQETILEGTGVSTVFGLLPRGVTLDQLAEIARQKTGEQVTVFRNLDLAAFREHLRHANDLSRRYVVNFSRGPLFGAGHGHHSPIAAYLADEDLVLVLDVNEEYGPWLVKSERLLEAMNTLDGDQKRGLLLME